MKRIINWSVLKYFTSFYTLLLDILKNDLNVLEGRGFARYEFQDIGISMGTICNENNILLKIPLFHNIL